MADILVNGITKSFEQDRVILDGISFQIDPGERVAILGDNGAGKTTLFRILTGELTPDRGSVSIPKGKRVGYVAQINTAKSEDTVEDVLRQAYADVIRAGEELDRMHREMQTVSASKYDEMIRQFEARGGYGWEAEMAKVANGLHIGPEMRAQRFSTLSGGEQTRVCLARMIMEQTDILLLDEPTNHLDVESLEWLEEYLLHFRGTVLVISHDRYFLDSIAQRIIEIKRGKAEFYSGNYTYYAQERELRYQQQLMQYNREQAKVKQLEFQIARLKAWGSVYDNPALHKKAAAMEKRVERVQQTDKPVKDTRMDAAFSSVDFRADLVLELKDITKAFDGQTLFEGISAQIRGGKERVALLGPNGAGKSTLLKIILGQLMPDRGSVKTGPSVRAAYLPQRVVFEHPERTLIDTMLYETSCSPQEARDRLGTFRFSGEDQFKAVSQLSGGERARLKLCIIMMNRANLLILDEPTNHLDLSSREWIEEAVSQFEGVLLFVSHDRYFIRRFANRVWEIDHGFTDYPDCDYDRYRRIRTLNRTQPAPEQKEAKPAARERKPAARDPKRERKMNVLEREIAAKEEQLKQYDGRMQEVATDYVELQRLTEEKEALEREIEGMYAEWEEMSSD
ncbi:MAG: ABC-F type ribosomal protection protein [Clostridia bacterium]|nr:ABC-F type ribosomal protection protein [Clostridia bacterium]